MVQRIIANAAQYDLGTLKNGGDSARKRVGTDAIPSLIRGFTSTVFFPFFPKTLARSPCFHVRGGLEERKLISWDFNGLRLTSARTNGKIPKTGIFPINTKLPNILMTVAVAVAVVGPLHQDHMRRSQHGNSNTS